MEYILNVCPVCGCGDLKRLSRTEVNGDVYYTCRCPACGATVSSEKKMLTAQAERRRVLLAEEGKKKPVEKSAADIFAENRASVVRIVADKGDYDACGTGMVLPNGYILSNAHIVFQKDKGGSLELADRILGQYDDGTTYELDLIYADIEKDMVLLQGENVMSRPVTFGKSPVITGEKVYAIGNSKGQGICIMDGIVSDSRRTVLGEEYIMISVPISHGNSGGPLFNGKGEVVGMTTMGRNDAIMNYAIPTPMLLAFLHEAVDKEGADIEEGFFNQ